MFELRINARRAAVTNRWLFDAGRAVAGWRMPRSVKALIASGGDGPVLIDPPERTRVLVWVATRYAA
jgi:hypothetical protein